MKVITSFYVDSSSCNWKNREWYSVWNPQVHHAILNLIFNYSPLHFGFHNKVFDILFVFYYCTHIDLVENIFHSFWFHEGCHFFFENIINDWFEFHHWSRKYAANSLLGLCFGREYSQIWGRGLQFFVVFVLKWER